MAKRIGRKLGDGVFAGLKAVSACQKSKALRIL